MINKIHIQKEEEMVVTLQPKPKQAQVQHVTNIEVKEDRKPLVYKSPTTVYQANKAAWKHYISQKPSGSSSGWGNLAWQHLAYLIVQGRYARVKKAFTPLNQKNAELFALTQGRQPNYKLADAVMSLVTTAKSVLYNLRREKKDVIYHPDVINIPFRGNIINADGTESMITMQLEVTKEIFEEITNLPLTIPELFDYLAGLKNTKD